MNHAEVGTWKDLREMQSRFHATRMNKLQEQNNKLQEQNNKLRMLLAQFRKASETTKARIEEYHQQAQE